MRENSTVSSDAVLVSNIMPSKSIKPRRRRSTRNIIHPANTSCPQPTSLFTSKLTNSLSPRQNSNANDSHSTTIKMLTLPTLALALLSLGTHVAVARPCASGEIGVGLQQQCDISGGCQAAFATVFDNDCSHTLGQSWGDDWCARDYSRNWFITCDTDRHTVFLASSNGVIYGNCYRPSNPQCNIGAGISTLYQSIRFCCRHQFGRSAGDADDDAEGGVDAAAAVAEVEAEVGKMY